MNGSYKHRFIRPVKIAIILLNFYPLFFLDLIYLIVHTIALKSHTMAQMICIINDLEFISPLKNSSNKIIFHTKAQIMNIIIVIIDFLLSFIVYTLI